VSEVDQEFERLVEYVRDGRGFDFTGYRRPTLERRFQKRMQAVGADTWDEYRSYLEQHPAEFEDLFNAILINVTGFFRDSETWELVASDVIPSLLEGRDTLAPIRVWSAGCASGEEAYTVAMLLAEALGEEDFRRRAKVYATDVDDEALAQAREATYTEKQLESVPTAFRERYFQAAPGGAFSFRNDLRRSIIFGRNDLHHDPPISRVDLLVSRNTLMYFSPDVQERILVNFHFALRPRGFLIVGKAEALQRGRRLFAAHDLKQRIFVRDGAADTGFRVSRLGGALDLQPAARDGTDLGGAAFEHAPLAQIVVDRDLTVMAINQATRSLFGLKLGDVGRPLQDLEVSYRPLEQRSLIGEARTKQKQVSARNVEWHPPRGGQRFLDVDIMPLARRNEPFAGVGIAFIDVTAHRTLEDDLERSRRELETAYQELQSTVEELETTNEELQSTNEELETTNEELQSTNEELETMNEELQSTNEELETINEELRERTEETLQTNAFLASVLSSIHQALIVVDRGLRVLAWSQRATELLGLNGDEVEGVALADLDVGLPVAELREPLTRVLAGRGDERETVLDGHNRRGQSVRYAVQCAPLGGGHPEEAPIGAIVLLSAERTD
jgi:two-component system CheB/CheR fusion protein